MYRTISQMQKANRKIRHHWFGVSEMAFFDTRIESGVIAGRFFVTSDNPGRETERAFSVRVCHNDGRVETHGEFMGYPDLDSALAAALLAGNDA